MGVHIDLLPIEAFGAMVTPPNCFQEMIMSDALLWSMVGDPTVVVTNPVYMIRSYSRIDSSMEKLSVCVTLLEVGHFFALFLASPLNYRKANHPPLELCP